MKRQAELVSLALNSGTVELVVRSPDASHLYNAVRLSYEHGTFSDAVISWYKFRLFPNNNHPNGPCEYLRLFAWVQNRVTPPPDVPEILERLQLTEAFGKMSQEQPLETLKLFAALNESPITSENTFGFGEVTLWEA